MTIEERLVLAIARDIVDRNSVPIASAIRCDDIDWSYFQGILIRHFLTPFAYTTLNGRLESFPDWLIVSLRATYYYSIAHIAALQQRFLDLHAEFEKNRIPVIPIKGIALLEDLYAHCPARLSSDMDILVWRENLDAACSVLEKLGFKKNLDGLSETYWRNKQYHLIFTKESYKGLSLVVELHWDIDYPRGKSLLPGMLRRLRNFTIQGNVLKALSPEDSFIGLALHQRRFGIALSLRDACDMALLLKKYASDFDWDYLLTVCSDHKLCSVVFFALCQIELFFGVGAPALALKGLKVGRLKRNVIRRFIEENTFPKDKNNDQKNLYLKAHFLLYDDFWEPVSYILNIPQEQFSKYYGLQPYSRKTRIRYSLRYLYMPIKYILARYVENTVYVKRKRE